MTEGRFAENILYFARALRTAGIPVGPGAVLDALEALSVARIGSRDDFYWTLHAVFVKRHEHTVLFDQAFKIFFRKRGYIEKMIASILPETPPGSPTKPPHAANRITVGKCISPRCAAKPAMISTVSPSSKVPINTAR